MAIFNAPRITTAQRDSLTLTTSEIVFDTNEKIFYGGDGSTVGGFPIGSGASTSQSVVCRNNTGSTIPQFRAVYINGASGNEPTVQLAIANTDPTSSKTFGVTKLPIANNTSGVIVHSGEIDDLNTSAFAEGDLLWLSPTTAGALTNVRPSSPNHAVFIGYIIRSHPTLGKIIVTIQNGLEIGELHDVEISLVADNQVLKYDATNLLWKNETLDAENIPMVSEAISVENKLILLQDEINGEISNRIFADEDLQGAINGEIDNRILADEDLQSAIDSIPGIYDTIDSVNDKISLANAYANTYTDNAVGSANAYTDEVATLTLLAANIYSDDASAGAVGSANAYTDSQIAGANAYTDAQIAAAPYANNTLSNLGVTAVNSSINPDSDAAYTLGTLGKSWSSVGTREVTYDATPNYDVELRKFADSASTDSLNYNSRQLQDTNADLVLDWGNCTIDKNRFGLIGDSFETVSKNLKQYNYVLNYDAGVLIDIVYDVPDVGSIGKTFYYTSGVLTSIELYGDLPPNIKTTKTLNYTSGVLTSIAYT